MTRPPSHRLTMTSVFSDVSLLSVLSYFKRLSVAVLLTMSMVSLGWTDPIGDNTTFSTGPTCDTDVTGVVEIQVDGFGSFGSSTGYGNPAPFDPADDQPDVGAKNTVYESMPFLCVERAGDANGVWGTTSYGKPKLLPQVAIA